MKQSVSEIHFYDHTSVEVVSWDCIHTCPMHVHETLCMRVITRGCAEFSNHTETRLLRAGDSYVIPAYTAHALSSVASQKFSYQVICFKQAQVQRNFNQIVQSVTSLIQQASKAFTIDTLSKKYISVSTTLIESLKHKLA